MATQRQQQGWDIAAAARQGVNLKLYNGEAGGDSTALSEVWPTASGFAFLVGDFAVVIGPAAAFEHLTRPDYTAYPVNLDESRQPEPL